MNIQVSAFLTHKLKETLDDCFDRYALSSKSDRFIVADGVSNSFFPGIWTELLCQAFIDYQEGDFRPSDPKCNEFINGYRRKWNEEVSRIANRPDAKFFTKRLFFQGNTAACAYVGFHFIWRNRYAIQTFALGDCCLFVFTAHNSPHELLFSSLKDTYVFNNFPHYVDSKPDVSYGETIIDSFDLPDTGLIIMASDALSKWIFENHAGEGFEQLIRLGSQEEFINWVEVYRQSTEHPLENDDVVLFRIAFSESTEQDLTVEHGSLFVIPSPSVSEQPPIETGVMPDESTKVLEVNQAEGPETPTDAEKPNDDLREVASSESIAFLEETINLSSPPHEIASTSLVGTVSSGTRNAWKRVTQRTMTILETAKEENLVAAFTEIIRQGIKDTVTTIRSVIDYPLDDGEKVKLIKALLEADTAKKKQNK